MAKEKKRRSRPKRNPHDPGLEASRRTKQPNLAKSTDIEAGAELAPASAHPFGHAVNPATGYVDAITGNDVDALTAADLEAGASAATSPETETGSHDFTGAHDSHDAYGAIDASSSPGVLDSLDSAGSADPHSALNRSTDDMEEASEELSPAPGVWVFPKLEIPVRRRSGLTEAQAFFEFTRRFSGYTGPQGAMTSASGEHAGGTASAGSTPQAGGTTLPAAGEPLQDAPTIDDTSNLENAANAPPTVERQENQEDQENLENAQIETSLQNSLQDAENAPAVEDGKEDRRDAESVVSVGSVEGVGNVASVDDAARLESTGGVESAPDEDSPSGSPDTINETDEEATRHTGSDETQRELH